MFKRLFDFFTSIALLIVFSPVLVMFSFLIWKQDYHTPFYIAPRVGKDGKIFKMIKFRSMIINADQSGVDSTSSSDSRITKLGKFIRKFKIDELPNFINIFKGDMSFVGPRPNVKRETDLYTAEEKKLLSVRPGITDIASIVFSDEGEVLEGSEDPDLDYNQLIRPWKSRLGIIYVEKRTLLLDIKLIFLTALSIFSRNRAINSVNKILVKLSAEDKLIEISKRDNQLTPFPPPGADEIVRSRE